MLPPSLFLARSACGRLGQVNSCGHSVWTLVLAPENRSLRRRKLESRSALGRRTGGGRKIDEERQRTTPEMFLGKGVRPDGGWPLGGTNLGGRQMLGVGLIRIGDSFCDLLLDATPLEQSQSRRQCTSGLIASEESS